MLQHFNNLKSSQEIIRLDALSAIVSSCRNAGSNTESRKSFDYAVDRFVKGLQSQVTTTRLEFYSGLTTLLGMAVRIDTLTIIGMIDNALKTGLQETKSDKKLQKIAQILSYGALVRAIISSQSEGDEPVDIDICRKLLKNLVDATVKRRSLTSLSTPFICSFLSLVPPGELDADLLSDLRRLIERQDTEDDWDRNYMKLVLTVEQRELTPSLIPDGKVEEIVKVLLAEGDATDSEFLTLVFNHIKRQNLFEAFWQIFVPSLGPYHTQLFCTSILHSIKSGCPLNYMLTEDIIQLILSVIGNSKLGREAKDSSTKCLQALLSWGECSLSTKERKSALKILYKKKPNLLFEYKFTAGIIRTHLGCLTAKELEYVVGVLLEIFRSDEGEGSFRELGSTISVLSSVALLKNSSTGVKMEIAKAIFQKGFCKPKEQGDTENQLDEDSAELLKTFSTQFVSTVEKSSDAEYVSELYDYVASVVDGGEDATEELLKPLNDKVSDVWAKASKLLRKITEPVVALITRAGAVHLVNPSEDFLIVYQNWLDLAKKLATKESPHEIIVFLVDQVAGMERPFFEYEAIFRKYAMEGRICEETVQALADAIDVADEFEADDSESDSDDDESESESDEEQEANGTSNDQLFSIPNSDDVMNGDSDSDATIDMDDATEEDLKKMDDALAGVFAAKKRVKEVARLEEVKCLRVLKLVDILVSRYKEPPISVVLILLMPLISSVKHNLSIKTNGKELNRTLASLTKLNKFKKFSGMEEVDPDVLSTMADEISEFMRKKTVPLHIKDVLAASRDNLLRNCQGAEREDRPDKKKHKKKKSNKTSQPQPSQSTDDPTDTLSSDDDELETIEMQGNNVPTDIPGTSDGAGPSASAKRKASAALKRKKAKLLRMEVLNEGLSVNE